MLLKDVKTAIAKKIQIKGGLKLPDDDILESIIHEAMIHVSTKTIPAELVRKPFKSVNETVLRILRDGKIVVVPEFPDLSSDVKHLQIDEDLNYAVINKTCALLCNKYDDVKFFELQTSEVINSHKANAIKIAQ